MSSTAANKTKNIAHRGARAFAPENTLVAFAKAKSFGCEMFELDVRLSKDEVVIVYHDDHLKRCTDAEIKFPGRKSYEVADFTYKELGMLDAGSWYIREINLPNDKRQPFLQTLSDTELKQFVSDGELRLYASGNIKIPSLTETLYLAKELNLMVNVELKSQPERDSTLVAGVLRPIKDLKMEDRILISSFKHELIHQIRLQTKSMETAMLVDKPPSNPITCLRKLKANAYNIGCYHDFRNDHFDSKAGVRYLAHIEKLRKAGFFVNIWTCNDQDEMKRLLTAGVSGLITDYPNRLRTVLADFETS